MRRFVTFLCIELCACMTEEPSSTTHQPQETHELIWSYDDETRWPGNRCQEGGRRQSPIDIRSENVIKDFNNDFIKYGALKFEGYTHVLMSGVNNGHTVQFNTEGDAAMQPMLTGGPLQHTYRLEQIHFHWLSEHAINGIKFPMEIHFVHVRIDLPVMRALQKRDGLAIIAVFCNVLTELEDDQQDVIEEIMYQIPELLETGDRISGVILDLTKLLSTNNHLYYTYAGSLTSPQCNEAVIWIIFNTPLYMSDAQYRLFGKIGIGRHNFRSLQKLTQHQVFTPVDTRIQTPQMIVFFQKVFNTVADFFRNMTTFMSKGFVRRYDRNKCRNVPKYLRNKEVPQAVSYLRLHCP